MLGEHLLQVLLDAVLLQAGVDAELVGGVVQDLLEQDAQRVARPFEPALDETVHSSRSTPSSSTKVFSRSVHGGDIQFSGL